MEGSRLLRLLDGGSRPFLMVRFEPGVGEPVARAHLSVNDPVGRETSCITLLLDGVERPAPPPLDPEQAWKDDRTMPEGLCVRIPADELVSALARFAGPRVLGCAMDDHTAAVLRDLGIEHMTIEEVMAALEPEATRHLERMNGLAKGIGSARDDAWSYVALGFAAGIIGKVGPRKFQL